MKEATVPAKSEQQTQPVAPGTREEARTLTPPVDIFEYEDGLGVVVDMPGVDKDDVGLRVEDDVLTIEGKAKAPEHGTSLYHEFDLVNYFRQFQLGQQVDQDKIHAEMKHGVLTIKLPKVEKAKPKKIAVNVAS